MTDQGDTDRRNAAFPRLAAVIFDLGGTLIYPSTTDEDCIRHLTAWLTDRGWPAGVAEAVREARRWVFAETAVTGRQHTTHEALRRALERFEQFERAAQDAGTAGQIAEQAVEQTGEEAVEQAGEEAVEQTGEEAVEQTVEQAERVFFEPELAGYRAFPGAVRLLQRIRQEGLHAGCISNATSHWLIERIVDRMGFRPYLDPVVSSAGFGRVKPDPGIFRHVLDAWGVAPEETAMVGDTLAADIAGGKAAGMRTLYVKMKPNPDNVNHPHVRADAEATTLAEAEEILLGWARAGR